MRRYYNVVMETATPDRLRSLQEAKLHAQIAYVHQHSPLMREKLDAANARPEDIRTLEDLVFLPFTTKEELRESQAQSPALWPTRRGDRRYRARPRVLRYHRHAELRRRD